VKLPHNTDTIVAMATGAGDAGIGIIRMSGDKALAIADALFVAANGKKASSFKTYTVHFGWVKDSNEIIDEVLVTVMRAPRSYTREDVVEINTHGGIIAMRRVLELALARGCRLAEPGEFTKRAFLNGRIDLAQAEAVLDIMRAQSDAALRVSMGQLEGALSSEISAIRNTILEALAPLEAMIDFPDEEIGAVETRQARLLVRQASERLSRLLKTTSYGAVLRQGLHVVICGCPNVGKSSLLNALVRRERSIVTSVAGTTRDTIEEIIDIRGIPVRIVDTAGILAPRNLVEKKAVHRAKHQIAMADLVLLIFDGSRPLRLSDRLLIKTCRKKSVCAVVNKIDLRQRIDTQYLVKHFGSCIALSARKGKHINLLEDAIAERVLQGTVVAGESVVVTNARHGAILRKTQKCIAESLVSLDNNLSLEFVTQDLKESVRSLDQLLGKEFSEDLLERIFGDFCIGK